MKLGCCGSMISPEADPLGIGIVEALAAMGFDYIELSLAAIAELSEAGFAELARRVRRSGIPCEVCNNFFPARVRLTGPEAYLPATLQYATAAMDRAACLGVSLIVFGSSAAKIVPPGTDVGVAWNQLAEFLQNLGPIAHRRGLTIVIEPLNRLESNIVNSAAEGLQLVREVNHPQIKLLVDYYHLMLERESPEIVLEAGDSLRHLHTARMEGRAFPLEPDDSYRRFFDLVPQIRYAGRCSLEAYTSNFMAEAPRLTHTKVPVYNSGRTAFNRVREILEGLETKG